VSSLWAVVPVEQQWNKRHGMEELLKFISTLTIHTKMKCTSEIERNGLLPSLDVLQTIKPDCSLGYAVYGKPTLCKFAPSSITKTCSADYTH
jgi:hypothetical protein